MGSTPIGSTKTSRAAPGAGTRPLPPAPPRRGRGRGRGAGHHRPNRAGSEKFIVAKPDLPGRAPRG